MFCPCKKLKAFKSLDLKAFLKCLYWTSEQSKDGDANDDSPFSYEYYYVKR
jgi:hypothetical protein